MELILSGAWLLFAVNDMPTATERSNTWQNISMCGKSPNREEFLINFVPSIWRWLSCHVMSCHVMKTKGRKFLHLTLKKKTRKIGAAAGGSVSTLTYCIPHCALHYYKWLMHAIFSYMIAKQALWLITSLLDWGVIFYIFYMMQPDE